MKKTLLKINSTAPVFLFILSNVWILWIFGYYQVQKTKNLAREVLVVMRYHGFIKSAL